MDRELAGAVISRWTNGLPVSETALYKAASALGIDPMAALIEARYYTYLDNYLSEKRAMSRAERIVFSAAAGFSNNSMEKNAKAFGVSTDELIVEALAANGFVPDVVKIANLAALMGDQQQGGQGQKGQQAQQALMNGGMPQMPGMDPSQGAAQDPQAAQQDPMAAQAGQAMAAPPQEGAALQQQPMFRPSPTAPEQVPPSPQGNMEQLLSQGQEAYGDQATENGGVAPAGMPEPGPEQQSPEQRIQQVGPNLDAETVSRYAEQLQRFEQGFGMQINDPKQMVKFVKELQKVDGKRVDQGIKAMGQQLEQEQAQELGVDSSPTIDGPGGGGNVLAPKPGGQAPEQQGAGGPPGQSPKPPMGMEEPQADPQQSAQPGALGNKPGAPSNKPKPQQKPVDPNQQAAQEAVEKVANAARLLARIQSIR